MRVFRSPRLAYLVVLLLFICTVPLAFSSSGGTGVVDDATGHGSSISGFSVNGFAVLLLIPVLAAAYIARSATIVDESGIRVRALFGTRHLPWEAVRGLSVGARSIYAVVDAGGVRLPYVRVANLHELAAASGGHLPEIAQPVFKPAPMRPRRVR